MSHGPPGQAPVVTKTGSPSIYLTPGRVRAFAVARMIPEKWLRFSERIMRHEWDKMTERSSEGLDARRKRLLFRAWRRGVRETDLIVGRFADAYIEKLDAGELDEFEKLIEASNADLYAWIAGGGAVPGEYDTTVLSKLRMFHHSAGAKR